jgi:hypothetical protein
MSRAGAVRVLGLRPGQGLPRAAVDWIADRQAYERVVVLPGTRDAPDLLARLAHPPFVPPDPALSGLAIEIASRLSSGENATAWAVEAAALALLEDGAVIVPDRSLFRDLISISSWSMNVSRPPTDGLLVQHLGIAARMPRAFQAGAAEALVAILAGGGAPLSALVRERRRRAREDGPVRFRRIAKKSAGLRPFVVYLDLLPAAAAAAAADEGLAEWLRALDGDAATRLLSTAAAIFI